MRVDPTGDFDVVRSLAVVGHVIVGHLRLAYPSEERGGTRQPGERTFFPDAQAGAYLLPVKKSIRAAAQLQADDVVEIELQVET